MGYPSHFAIATGITSAPECFDIDASPIISSGVSIDEMGEKILSLVIDVASGKQTAAEILGGDELFCVARRHGIHKTTSDCEC